jgi:hypothetical protein
MTRRLRVGTILILTFVVQGCTDSSQYPTVPPPPPAGSVPETPPVGTLPERLKGSNKGKPAPTTPTAL